MREVLSLGIRLLVITLIAGVLLGGTYVVTKEPIEQQVAMKSEQARMDVLPSADSFEAVPEEILKSVLANLENGDRIIEVFQGLAAGQPVGFTVKVTPGGFGGDIELTVGLDMEMNVTGISIGSHSETPGLGANLTNEAFMSQYAGKPGGELTVIKSGEIGRQEVMAITGATITTRSVTAGVNLAAQVCAMLLGGAGS